MQVNINKTRTAQEIYDLSGEISIIEQTGWDVEVINWTTTNETS